MPHAFLIQCFTEGLVSCHNLQVPYALVDEEIPDHWTCSDNLWDASRRSCTVPQELPDNEIDEILLAQVRIAALCP